MTKRPFILALLLTSATTLSAQGADGATNQTDALGRKQGTWVRNWAQSDQVRYRGQFKDDKPVGSFVYYSTKGWVESRIDHYPGGNGAHGRHFHENGTLMAEGRYAGQQKDSVWNYYDDQGKLRSTERWKQGRMHGEMTTYYPTGQVTEKVIFHQGELDGPAERFFADGKPKYRGTYLKGKADGMETHFFPNGKPEIEGRYTDGKRQGNWKYYNEDGSVRLQTLYDKGQVSRTKYENGTFMEYWDDDQPKSEVIYRNGKREGPFTEWHDNGKWVEVPTKVGPQGAEKGETERKLTGQTKHREGAYRNDVLEGPVKEYDEKGKLISNLTYVNGAPATSGAKP